MLVAAEERSSRELLSNGVESQFYKMKGVREMVMVAQAYQMYLIQLDT
jgi:hypothetical protein